MPGIVLVQETFGLHYNFGEFSIPWFTAFCLTRHVCHCHQWRVLDNQFCLRISQALILTGRIATLWVIGALSLCALHICSRMLWEYMNISSRYMARAAYRSKLDMFKTYEQICIVPEHIHKMAFATVLGTFRSQVMQMGDCNAPSMFQRLMTAIFWDCIHRFVHVYLDNIFIYLCSIEEHEKHLEIVFQWLKDHHLFLIKSKDDLYSKRLECLGHIIDDWGIHADADKMQHIRDWRHPRTFNNVQCFLGLVQYLAHYMPDISTYTTPLSGCIRNSCPFEWMPLLEKCFETIKTLACKAPILKSIDYDNPDPIWVITNGSKAGVGAIYSQGPNWKTCQPARFMSKKFINAQQHYQTHEHEMITVLEALMK